MSDILLSAFALSVVLLGIHSFYGIEIIRRGIIFTDLAIGQMAAMGAAVAILFFDGEYLDVLSLAFALVGGGIVAAAARRTRKHEAFIGLLYAFGLSAVFIILSQSSHGTEAFQKLMASDILFTPVSDLVKAAIVYLVIGGILMVLYTRSTGVVKEAVFFVTFAVTVTIAVRLAGVLVVFALLVGPALIALRIKRGIPVVNAWIIGTLINLGSIQLSYRLDLPTGYTLVCFHAAIALAVTLAVPERNMPEAGAVLPSDRPAQRGG
jgi:zinc/manganese transport system permease protein